ncbi:extensin-like [Perognathus longimembris pacificus]|uniref:extensin-like n=1 Tax=Perognathus longimembris pacificus TaxID=214514 RepID=UPI00201914AF|nr:extensin-like [Perognathus longimembris pacificus]
MPSRHSILGADRIFTQQLSLAVLRVLCPGKSSVRMCQRPPAINLSPKHAASRLSRSVLLHAHVPSHSLALFPEWGHEPPPLSRGRPSAFTHLLVGSHHVATASFPPRHLLLDPSVLLGPEPELRATSPAPPSVLPGPEPELRATSPAPPSVLPGPEPELRATSPAPPSVLPGPEPELRATSPAPPSVLLGPEPELRATSPAPPSPGDPRAPGTQSKSPRSQSVKPPNPPAPVATSSSQVFASGDGALANVLSTHASAALSPSPTPPPLATAAPPSFF